MSEDCIFCKIAKGEMNTKFVYKDELVVAFDDIHPLAPVHVLVVPVQHINSLAQVDAPHEGLLGRLMRVCNEVAKLKGVQESGYRVLINTGKDGRQIINHLHIHVLGGRKMKTEGD
jgi:histidine triad (HIT) family protein